MSIKPPSDDLKRRVGWLMTFRVVIVTLLMGATAFIHLKEGGGLLAHAVIPIYILVAVSYLITLFSSLVALKLGKVRDWFADLQVAADILLYTAFVYVTGGVDSIFSFLYIFVIIWAGIVLRGRRVVLTASLSSILYGALVDLQYYEFLPLLESPLSQPQAYSDLQIFYKIFINITAFYTVALLSRHLFVLIRKTDERLKEKEIDYEALEELNKKIVEEIKSGLVTIDPKGLITSFNKAAEDITGYTLIEAYNSRVDEIFPGLMERVYKHKEHPLYKSGAGRWEMPYMSKDGNSLHLGFSLSSRKGRGGKEGGNIIVFQNLTPYKEMEEAVRQAEKLATVGRFAAGIAHEIRNPLASMSSSIQILRDELELDEENRRLMAIILKEMERINGLIGNFLDYARPYKPKKDEIDFSRIMLETLDVFEKGLSQNRKIRIEKEILSDIKIHGEEEKLKEVLWNLFNNAVQSMLEEGEIAVSLKRYDKKVIAVIRDSGEGIDEKDMNRVFEPFFTTKSYGTGLGLATVQRIVEAHGGEIRVESKKGKGTSFMVILPIE